MGKEINNAPEKQMPEGGELIVDCDRTQVTLRIDSDLVALFDEIASMAGTTRETAMNVALAHETLMAKKHAAQAAADASPDAYYRDLNKEIELAVRALGVELHFRDDGSFAGATMPEQLASHLGAAYRAQVAEDLLVFTLQVHDRVSEVEARATARRMIDDRVNRDHKPQNFAVKKAAKKKAAAKKSAKVAKRRR